MNFIRHIARIVFALLSFLFRLVRPKIDIVNYWKFITDSVPTVPDRFSYAARTINWFVPPFGYGSGGHLNIVRFIKYLEDDGYECRVIVINETRPLASETIRKQIADWYMPINATVYQSPQEDIPASDFAFATGWQTAYSVKNFNACTHKCYFVQDYETIFSPAGTEAILADNTYQFGFVGFTFGGWLAKLLHEKFGMDTHELGFSYEDDLYKPSERVDINIKRVLFYARPETPRRAFDLGILVLDKVISLLPNIEIVLVGGDISNYVIPFPHKDYGRLSLSQLPALYSQCDVALVLSLSNLSLLPLEIMACGCAVVSNNGPNVEWLLNADNCKLCNTTVDDLADGLVSLLTDDEERKRLIANGFAVAKKTSWQSEAKKLSILLRQLV